MSFSLEFTAERKSKLIDEFRTAINATSGDHLQAWGIRTAEVLGEVTIRRGKNFGSLLSRVWNFASDETRGLLAALRRDNAVAHLRARGRAAGKQAQALGRGFSVFYERFSSNLRNRSGETASKVALGIFGFLVGSGGVDGDGGIPDLDLLGGIGAHRSILTHSIVSGILIETFLLSFLDLSKTIYRNLPTSHDQLWDDINAASDDVLAALTAGISLGLAHHLTVDATIDGDGTYKGLPSVPAEVHQAILGANALAQSAEAAKQAFEVATKKTEEKLFKTYREATDFAKRNRGWAVVRANDMPGFEYWVKPPGVLNLLNESFGLRRSRAVVLSIRT